MRLEIPRLKARLYLSFTNIIHNYTRGLSHIPYESLYPLLEIPRLALLKPGCFLELSPEFKLGIKKRNGY